MYLEVYVLLTADVFDNFPATCLKIYNFDGLPFYTAHGVAFERSMLKITQVKLELMPGISQCSNRYCKTNNKYMGYLYNSAKSSSVLIYSDVLKL